MPISFNQQFPSNKLIWFILPVDYDECRSNPCLNGGSCYHGVGQRLFICNCPSGWQGTTCELGESQSKQECPSSLPGIIQERAVQTKKYVAQRPAWSFVSSPLCVINVSLGIINSSVYKTKMSSSYGLLTTKYDTYSSTVIAY